MASASICDPPTSSIVEELAASTDTFEWEGYDLAVLQTKDRPGFKQFVASNRDALKTLAGLREEQQVIEHLLRHTSLLEGVAHCRAWFFDRHLAASKTARLAAQIEDEAAGFMLLDAAADSARVCYMSNPSNNIHQAAVAGVRAVAVALVAEGDAAGLRESLGLKIQRWTGLVKRAADMAQSRQQMKSKSKLQLSSKKKAAEATAATPHATGSAAIPEEQQPTGAGAEEQEAPLSDATEAATETGTSGGAGASGAQEERKEERKEEEEDPGIMGFFKGWWGN